MRLAKILDGVYGIAFVEVDIEKDEIRLGAGDLGDVAVFHALRNDGKPLVLGE
jgi:hypothetical protein